MSCHNLYWHGQYFQGDLMELNIHTMIHILYCQYFQGDLMEMIIHAMIRICIVTIFRVI